MRFYRHPAFLGFLKIFLGALFLISSVPKIISPEKFIEAIAAYQMVPPFLLPAMAATLPWVQIAAGIFLLLDIFIQSSALIISGMLVVFIVAISSAYARGLDIDCGCFDLVLLGIQDHVGWGALIRDTVFLAAALLLAIFDKNSLNFYGLARKLFKK